MKNIKIIAIALTLAFITMFSKSESFKSLIIETTALNLVEEESSLGIVCHRSDKEWG